LNKLLSYNKKIIFKNQELSFKKLYYSEKQLIKWRITNQKKLEYYNNYVQFNIVADNNDDGVLIKNIIYSNLKNNNLQVFLNKSTYNSIIKESIKDLSEKLYNNMKYLKENLILYHSLGYGLLSEFEKLEYYGDIIILCKKNI
jgi:hypothetical protein